MNKNDEHRPFNQLLQKFADRWNKLKSKFLSPDKKHCNKQVAAVLNGTNPEFGFSQYMCLGSEQENKVVAHSCKSDFCLRCSRVDGESFAESIVFLPIYRKNIRNLVRR